MVRARPPVKPHPGVGSRSGVGTLSGHPVQTGPTPRGRPRPRAAAGRLSCGQAHWRPISAVRMEPQALFRRDGGHHRGSLRRPQFESAPAQSASPALRGRPRARAATWHRHHGQAHMRPIPVVRTGPLAPLHRGGGPCCGSLRLHLVPARPTRPRPRPARRCPPSRRVRRRDHAPLWTRPLVTPQGGAGGRPHDPRQLHAFPTLLAQPLNNERGVPSSIWEPCL